MPYDNNVVTAQTQRTASSICSASSQPRGPFALDRIYSFSSFISLRQKRVSVIAEDESAPLGYRVGIHLIGRSAF
jgi:hypothetical protein